MSSNGRLQQVHGHHSTFSLVEARSNARRKEDTCSYVCETKQVDVRYLPLTSYSLKICACNLLASLAQEINSQESGCPGGQCFNGLVRMHAASRPLLSGLMCRPDTYTPRWRSADPTQIPQPSEMNANEIRRATTLHRLASRISGQAADETRLLSEGCLNSSCLLSAL